MANSANFDILLESIEELRNIDSMAYDVLSNNTFEEETSIMKYDSFNNVSETYSRKINESFSALSSVTVDSNKITDFFVKVREYPSFENYSSKIYLKGIQDKVVSVKPMYLVQYVSDAAKIIDSIVKGKYTDNDVSSYFSPDMMLRMKRQLIRGLSNPQEDLSSYVFNGATMVTVNQNFLMNTALPFLKNFDSYKKEITDEMNACKSNFKTCSEKIDSYNEVIQKMLVDRRLSESTIKTLNFFLYNFNRSVSQLLSYVSFMMVKKIDDCIFNMTSLSKLYDAMTEHFASSSPVVHESAMDAELYDTEKDALIDELYRGDSSTLSAICSNYYRKNRSDYTNMSSERDSLDNLDVETSNVLDTEVYEDIERIFDSFNESLDTFSENLKDSNNVFDDIVTKSGLNDSLYNRFKVIITAIPKKGIPDDPETLEKDKRYVLFGLLNELHHGSDSCEKIAEKVISSVNHLRDVSREIEYNTGNIYPNYYLNQEAITYLMNSLNVELRSVVGGVAEALVDRYKRINDCCAFLMKPEVISIESTGEVPFALIENIDYFEMAYENILDSQEDITRSIFESKMEEHARRKQLQELASISIFEADDPNKTQSVEVKDNSDTSQAGQEQNANAADMVNKDSNAEGTTSGDPNTAADKFNFEDFKNKIAEFFDKMIQKFTDTISKVAPINQKFFNNSKAALLARSYDNVSLKMANYGALKENVYLSDIGKLKNAVSSLTADQLRSGNKEEITNHLLAFIPGIQNVENKSTALTNYYKTGKVSEKEIPITEFKNAALKDEVNKMITFCEGFYNGEFQQVADQLKDVKESLKSKISEVSSDTTENASAKTGINTASSVVKLYSAALLNCYRDRANDNIRALRKLVPKKGKNAPQPETSEAPEAPAEQAPEQTEGNTEQA